MRKILRRIWICVSIFHLNRKHMKHLRTIRGRTWCPEPPKLYAQRIAQRRIGFYLLILALAVGSWAPAQADIFFRGISAETTLQAESASILGGASIYNDGA
ncbi:MAG TPA: hypothetical protein DCE41_12510, partial [Cytophagales bacterium]|nr:hypothetical protein [Cytophagales bacterium]